MYEYTYTQILEKLKDSPVPLEHVQGSQVNTGLKMVKHHHPWSISQDEFKYITLAIKHRNLQSGFEVATAFGISALAAGLGFQETGGKLITMDAYIEEHYNYCGGYRDKFEIYDFADGLQSVKYIIQEFELESHIIPVVGWSPNDISRYVKDTLDYAFIDGGHWEEQIIKDTEEIAKYLSKNKFTVFFHDGQGLNPNLRDRLANIVGAPLQDVCGMPDCWFLVKAEK